MKEMLRLAVRGESMTTILLLSIHCTQSTNTEVRCDPDVPSRPQPRVSPLALALGHSLATECPEGEYLDWNKCSPCKDGTYRTKQMAAINKYSRCEKCQSPVTSEIIEQPCKATRDTLISCEDGYYRYQAPGKPCDSSCKICSTCGLGNYLFLNYVGRECSKHSDTVCCREASMVMIDGMCVPSVTTTSPLPTLESVRTTSYSYTTENRSPYGVLTNQKDLPRSAENEESPLTSHARGVSIRFTLFFLLAAIILKMNLDLNVLCYLY